jgi:hypothetical protein
LLVGDIGVIGGQFILTKVKLFQILIDALDLESSLRYLQFLEGIGVIVVIPEVEVD